MRSTVSAGKDFLNFKPALRLTSKRKRKSDVYELFKSEADIYFFGTFSLSL